MNMAERVNLALSSLQSNTDIFVNSADPDETARNHQDLPCLPFHYWFLTETPICDNGCVHFSEVEESRTN